ncbi:MAG: hypothetical protein JWR66_2854 [Modestobacter sp.]|jgi:hypothetical protein|nr:hypothetical protein [Modestobacter sp.]
MGWPGAARFRRAALGTSTGTSGWLRTAAAATFVTRHGNPAVSSELMAEEQAALRRVATLVAGAAMPEALPRVRTRVKHCPRPRAILM